MEDFKVFFKEHWKLLSIILLIFTLVPILQCGSDRYNASKEAIHDAELKMSMARQADSINTARNKAETARFDSLQKENNIKVEAAKAEARQYHILADKYKKKADKAQDRVDDLLAEYGDSLNTPCKEIVKEYKEVVQDLTLSNDAKNEEINELNIALTEDSIGWDNCKKVNAVKDNTIAIKETRIAEQDIVIENLKKELKKQNSFFRKNVGWFGTGAGFLLGILLMK
jgi:hypothetical protein